MRLGEVHYWSIALLLLLPLQVHCALPEGPRHRLRTRFGHLGALQEGEAHQAAALQGKYRNHQCCRICWLCAFAVNVSLVRTGLYVTSNLKPEQHLLQLLS
jgi:hypothetical protein